MNSDSKKLIHKSEPNSFNTTEEYPTQPILRSPSFTMKPQGFQSSPSKYNEQYPVPKTTESNVDTDIATYYYQLYQAKKLGKSKILSKPNIKIQMTNE